MALAFAVPPAAKAVLGLICQLQDGPREDAFVGLVSVLASGNYPMMSALWEGLAARLGLTVTAGECPQAGAMRESADPLTNRVAWRL